MGFFSGLANRLMGAQKPKEDPGGTLVVNHVQLAADAITAQQDAAALVDNAYQDAMKDPPAGWPKKRKRQPIKARKALKKAKARKRK